jgi:hypothetical protein
MTTYQQQAVRSERPLGWPIVAFFVLAYAIAWGAFGILGVIARQSGVESTQTFMTMAEAFQFEGVSLSVAPWLVYLLTRLADFARRRHDPSRQRLDLVRMGNDRCRPKLVRRHLCQ